MVLTSLHKYGLDKHGLVKHGLDKHDLDKHGLDIVLTNLVLTTWSCQTWSWHCLSIMVLTNVCKKREKFNIRPVLSLQDSSGSCPEVPQGPAGQTRPDLSPYFRFFRIPRVSPRPQTYSLTSICWVLTLNAYFDSLSCWFLSEKYLEVFGKIIYQCIPNYMLPPMDLRLTSSFGLQKKNFITSVLRALGIKFFFWSTFISKNRQKKWNEILRIYSLVWPVWCLKIWKAACCTSWEQQTV